MKISGDIKNRPYGHGNMRSIAELRRGKHRINFVVVALTGYKDAGID